MPNEGVDALLIPDVAAAALAGISRAHLHRLRAAGQWGPTAVKLGRKVLYRRQDVIDWIGADCPDFRTWTAMQAQQRRTYPRVV
jgi:predicted DNA-binding transcriptional regulator AlpA